ncbi:AfsR/SARP family transcriptional regulator [Streptomyces coffeae]|uniref:Winged helix-turn-helix domain-containing protein n=1 Tax=Streptomyces coffeae TaxID=621382 RepID=A0ABS1NPV6_9ACTN|nr:BTAD domain-containing putative transcriptional regulator [Streptomyces coffeae]MBL1102121.1 winged helix-turn-helix domain-containing protein [Streptomyces coffeae]
MLGAPGIYDEARQRPIRLNSPKQRLLLGALLAWRSSPVPTAALIKEVWGDLAPDKAVNALQAHVSRLRQLLIESEPARAKTPRLIARGSGYLLDVRPEELDCVRFRLLVARALKCADDPNTAAQLLQRAMALWSSPDPQADSYGPLYAQIAARLEEERLRALEHLYAVTIRLGRCEEVLAPLKELAAAHPERPVFRDQWALARRRWEQQPSSPPRPPHEAGVWPSPEPVAPRPTAVAPPARDTAATQEIDRLRQHVDRLTEEQGLLWAALEKMTTLVAPESSLLPRRRDTASPPALEDLGELHHSSADLLIRSLKTRRGFHLGPTT